MAGGIFVDQPYHPNPKCLFFAAVIMAIYWFSPAEKNELLLPVIFVVAYVAMAWYDYMYNCDTIMYSGSAIGPNTFDAIFKPQRRGAGKKLSAFQEREYLSRVYLFHIFAVVPVLLYAGYFGTTSNVKIFPVIFVMGLIALVYHGFRIFFPRDTSE